MVGEVLGEAKKQQWQSKHQGIWRHWITCYTSSHLEVPTGSYLNVVGDVHGQLFDFLSSSKENTISDKNAVVEMILFFAPSLFCHILWCWCLEWMALNPALELRKLLRHFRSQWMAKWRKSLPLQWRFCGPWVSWPKPLRLGFFTSIAGVGCSGWCPCWGRLKSWCCSPISSNF